MTPDAAGAANTILTTRRLVLRSWTYGDAPSFFAIWSDPRVTEHIAMPPIADIAAARTRLDRVRGQIAARGFGHWALEEKESGELVGSAGFRATDGAAELEVGFTTAPSRWGRGYATEVTAACVAYGFARLAAPRIVSLTMPANARARRVLEKIGMRLVGHAHEDGATWCVYETTRGAPHRATPPAEA